MNKKEKYLINFQFKNLDRFIIVNFRKKEEHEKK